MTSWQWLVGIAELAVAAVATDWLLMRRPLHGPSDKARANRHARLKRGKPLRYRCIECGIKLRHHVWTNRQRLGADYCEPCAKADPTFAGGLGSGDGWIDMDIVCI